MTTALVTGSTAGIGAEFARQLAARGDDLVLVARDQGRLAAQAQELTARYGVRCEVLPADLAVRADIDAVAARLGSVEEPIDVLVNNAGFGFTTTLLDADTRELERALDVMALAPMLLGGAAGRAMASRGRGRIINVASLAAWIAQGGYSAVKSYAKVWSEGLAGELAGSGVTVTALCPGWVTTEFHERAGLDGQARSIPGPVWVSAERCVRECLADAERGRVVSIPTKRWKLAAFALQHAPRGVVHAISRRLSRAKAS